VAADTGKVDGSAEERPAVVVAFAWSEPGDQELQQLFPGAGRRAGAVSIFWDATTASS
jgi:hypothetical protein